MRIVTVIGARPQFIKSALLSEAIDEYNSVAKTPEIEELVLHTGQHYDANMNDVFFNALNVRRPHWQLHCGGIASIARMLSEMITGIEKALIESRPDYVIVFGDTTSTLAGALAASTLHIPVIHIEAGLRSFNRQMQEETNRILTDHIASLLFCPTFKAVENLAKENITDGLFHTGDVMYDAALLYSKIADDKSQILKILNISPEKFRLCTVHRAENTNNPDRLSQIIIAMVEAATENCPIIFPAHPRTRLYIANYNLNGVIASNPALKLIEPVDYIDMVALEKNALTILTDSGGVQKEAYFHQTPCITLRDETEWVETIEAGWNQLAGYETDKILNCLKNSRKGAEINEYGNGHAAVKTVEAIVKYHYRADNQ